MIMKLRVLALATVVFAALAPVSSQAFVAVSVNFAPPPLVVAEPGPVPAPGFIWTPGYWAWDPAVGYYWVPGAWVPAPEVGLLWTPPWWGFSNGVFLFHEGFWGPTVGFYGGINYGFGYFGSGFWGGRWDGNVFFYNTAVVRVDQTVIKNVFVDRTVLSRQATASRASFNGPGGVQAQQTAEEKAAEANARKVPPTSQQLARREAAAKNPDLQASVNKGHPKPEAIKAFNKTHEQAQAGAAKAAAGQATAATAKTKAAAGAEKAPTKAAAGQATAATTKTKAATGAEKTTTAGRERANTQTAAARERSAAERREAELRERRAHENANVARQREMAERSRRPEVTPGRQVAATRRAEPAGQQQRTQQQAKQQQAKKKPAKGQTPEPGQR
jgi:hypothetical protein